jgi:hypothetical protein
VSLSKITNVSLCKQSKVQNLVTGLILSIQQYPPKTKQQKTKTHSLPVTRTSTWQYRFSFSVAHLILETYEPSKDYFVN